MVVVGTGAQRCTYLFFQCNECHTIPAAGHGRSKVFQHGEAELHVFKKNLNKMKPENTNVKANDIGTESSLTSGWV